MLKRVMLGFATAFGLGLSPVASGTCGAIPGVAIVLACSSLSLSWQIALAAALAVVAVPICDVAEHRFGVKDDRRIVADEYLTFPICMLGLPAMAHPWLYPLAFVVSRAMDVIKPPPARQIQALRGGLGIVLDDVIAGFYALAINHAIVWVARRFGVV